MRGIKLWDKERCLLQKRCLQQKKKRYFLQKGNHKNGVQQHRDITIENTETLLSSEHIKQQPIFQERQD